MPHGLFQAISGKKGEIVIEALGVVVGSMYHWSLTRREDGDPSGLYDLRAAFSYVNQYTWADPDYEKMVCIHLGQDQFKLEMLEGSKVSLVGESLLMEGVRLCQL